MSTYRSVNSSPGDGPGAALRQRILDAASETFAELGYAGASVRTLTEAAGVTKPMLYYYFASKEGLYQTVVALAAQQLHSACKRVAEGDGTPRQKLSEIAALYLDEQLSRAVRLLAAATTAPPGSAPMEAATQFIRDQEALVASILATGDPKAAPAQGSPLPSPLLVRAVLQLLADSVLRREKLAEHPHQVARALMAAAIGEAQR